MIDLDLFFDIKRTLPWQVWQPILWKNGKLPTFVALAFRNGMGYRYINMRVNSANDACVSCENFVKFGPVTPELTGLICECLVQHGQKCLIWSNISESAWPIFTIYTPYESALCADDGSVAYFQFVKGRCHGNQIMLRKCYQRRLIPLAFSALVLENELQYHDLAVHINNANDASISCAKFREIRSSNSRVDRAHLKKSGTTRPKTMYLVDYLVM